MPRKPLEIVKENKQRMITKTFKHFKRIRLHRKREIHLSQLLFLLLFIGCWECVYRLADDSLTVLSSPSLIASWLINQSMQGSLLSSEWITISGVFVAWVVGVSVGITTAAALWWVDRLGEVIVPLLRMLNLLPKPAVVPIFLLMFGNNYVVIVAVSIWMTFHVTTLVVYRYFCEVDSNYINVIRMFGENKKKIWIHVIKPASTPFIISCSKSGISTTWLGLTIGEIWSAKQGLGALIMQGFLASDYTKVFASVFLLGCTTLCGYFILNLVEQKISQRYLR